jgi:hypothetical protein
MLWSCTLPAWRCPEYRVVKFAKVRVDVRFQSCAYATLRDSNNERNLKDCQSVALSRRCNFHSAPGTYIPRYFGM